MTDLSLPANPGYGTLEAWVTGHRVKRTSHVAGDGDGLLATPKKWQCGKAYDICHVLACQEVLSLLSHLRGDLA